MYTYYTCSTLNLAFAKALKKSMTTAQITQLVVGCFVASMYLWVQYSPSAYTAGALPSVGDLDTVLSTNGWYRALRDAVADDSWFPSTPSVSESVDGLVSRSSAVGYSSASATTTLVLRESLRQAASNHGNGKVHCCASTGQAFAVIFNVAYLLPLIALFLRFYFGSYRKVKAE